MSVMRLGKDLGLALCIVAANCGAPVIATAAPLTVTAKTRAFDGKVEIDRRLNRYPKLRAFLLAEGKRTLAAQRKEADDMRKRDPQLFRNSRRWTFERRYAFRSDVAPYVSIVRTDFVYTGGAHPNTRISTLLWDKSADRFGNVADLFGETRPGGPTMVRLAALVRDALAAEKKKRGIEVTADPARDEWLKAVEPAFDKLGQPSLAPSTVAGKSSGITFHFSPYDVGPYVEGSYAAFVPANALAPLLKPEARNLFAGERPKSDEAD